MDVKKIIGRMTPEEKCAMLAGKNHWESMDYPHHDIPSIFFADGPHGVRKQLGSADHLGLNASQKATCFPTAATIANSWNPALGEKIGAALGREAAQQKVDVLLAPGLNIKRSPLCGRNFEYFSEDPYLSGKMAAGYVRGIQSEGVAACPKHFAVNSQETVRMSSDSIVDERTLREIYLAAFEIVVTEAAPRSIMTSYNRVNGTYANENPFLLQDILRKEWGFKGMVVTDWGGSNEHVDGVRAGSTLEMPNAGFDSARELLAAVENGSLAIESINARVEEVLHEALRERKATPPNLEIHHALAREAAEESIVLLRNQNNILPLQKGAKVAIVGDFAQKPRYQGAGSSFVEPTQLATPLESLNNSRLAVQGYAQGYQRLGGVDEGLFQQALVLAEKADVVLFYMGFPEGKEVEGMDRAAFDIPQNQVKLLHALQQNGHKVVAVLTAGSAFATEWVCQCEAVLHGYLGGQAGAEAMVRVMTGEVCPSGKLAESYPHALQDTPEHYNFPSAQRTAEYREGLYVGYRYYEKVNVPPAFAFGHGLSYTTFAYEGLQVSSTEASFSVINTGRIAGAEIAQLYIGCKQQEVFRPVKELKGFAKVFLQPGESRKVSIALNKRAFAYYNVTTQDWETEQGAYTVYIGASAAEIKLTAPLPLQGSGAPCPYNPEQLAAYYSGQIQQVSNEAFGVLLGRPIPKAGWPSEMTINSPLCRMKYAKSGLARFVFYVLEKKKAKKEAAGVPDLNMLFIFNVPLRAVAKMTNGLVSKAMAQGMLQLVNGHFFKGMGSIVSGYFRNAKANKKYKQLLAAQQEQSGTGKE